MNYQEYNWAFDPNNVSTSTSTTTSTSDPWVTTNTNLGSCVGDYCCASGTSYDSSLNQCVVSSSTESFVNNVLSKTQPNKNNKIDYDLSEPMPSNM